MTGGIGQLLKLTVFILTSCVATGSASQSVAAASAADTGNDASSSIYWGLADAKAYVGKLFSYSVGSGSNCSTKIKISEDGKQLVPSWLSVTSQPCQHFLSRDVPRDDCIETFMQGVASDAEVGRRYEVSVDDACQKRFNDVFSIDVLGDTDILEVGLTRVQYGDDTSNEPDVTRTVPVLCGLRSAITRASVIVDADWSALTSGDRVAILRRFADHLQLPVSVVSLLPRDGDVGATVLVAGPGDIHRMEELSIDDGVQLRWIVGCGNVQAPQMAVLERLETTSQDGRLSRDIGWPVIGWQITNHVWGRRFRRSNVAARLIRPTATLRPVYALPTGSPANFAEPTQSSVDSSRSAAHSPRHSSIASQEHDDRTTDYWRRIVIEQPITRRQPAPTRTTHIRSVTARNSLEPSKSGDIETFSTTVPTTPLPVRPPVTRRTHSPLPKSTHARSVTVRNHPEPLKRNGYEATSTTVPTTPLTVRHPVAKRPHSTPSRSTNASRSVTARNHPEPSGHHSRETSPAVAPTTKVHVRHITERRGGTAVGSTAPRTTTTKRPRPSPAPVTRRTMKGPQSMTLSPQSVTIIDSRTSQETIHMVRTEFDSWPRLVDSVVMTAPLSTVTVETATVTTDAGTTHGPHRDWVGVGTEDVSRQSITAKPGGGVSEATSLLPPVLMTSADAAANTSPRSADDADQGQSTTSAKANELQTASRTDRGTTETEHIGVKSPSEPPSTLDTTQPIPDADVTTADDDVNFPDEEVLLILDDSSIHQHLTTLPSAPLTTTPSAVTNTTQPLGDLDIPQPVTTSSPPPPLPATTTDGTSTTVSSTPDHTTTVRPPVSVRPINHVTPSTRPRHVTSTVPTTTTTTKRVVRTTTTMTTTTRKPRRHHRPPTTTARRPRRWTVRPPYPNPRVNHKPEVRNPIGRLEIHVGNVLMFRIPDDTFIDQEDGETSNMQTVLTNGGMSLSPNMWVKLNYTTHTLYGLPLGRHIGIHRFVLSAIDRGGKIEHTPFEILVRAQPPDLVKTHEFSVVLNMDYELFDHDVELRVDVANKIASAFGDRDARLVGSVHIREGSVIYSWSNNTLNGLSLGFCPDREILHLAAMLTRRDGSPTRRFRQALQPYDIKSVDVQPLGPCKQRLNLDAPVDGEDADVRTRAKQPPGGAEASEFDAGLLVYILIPLVITAAVLFIILLVCIVRYGPHRPVKDPNDCSSSTLDAGRKGIPVIFAGELNPDPGDLNNRTAAAVGGELTPVDPADEFVAPLPPPDYTSTIRSRDSTLPRSDYKLLLVSSDEEDGTEDQLMDGLRRRRVREPRRNRASAYSVPAAAAPPPTGHPGVQPPGYSTSVGHSGGNELRPPPRYAPTPVRNSLVHGPGGRHAGW